MMRQSGVITEDSKKRTKEEIIDIVNRMSCSEKTELACRIIEERLLDYFLALDSLGLGESNSAIQKKAEDTVRSKVLLYDRLDYIPIKEIRNYVNLINKEMQ